MVCPRAAYPSVAAQRRLARQYSPATIASGKPIGPAYAGRVSAYALDGTNLPQNQFGPTSNPFDLSPYNLDGIAASVKPVPLANTPTLTTTTTTVKAPTAAAVAAQKRKKKAAATKRRVVYYM